MPRVALRFRIVQPGGAVRRVHHESELVLDQHGVAVRWIGTYRDVTEAYEAEESFKLVFEDNPVPMWLFDPETLKFLAVNDAAVAHYGYDQRVVLEVDLARHSAATRQGRNRASNSKQPRCGRKPQPSLATCQGGWDGKSTSSLIGATPPFAAGPRSLSRSWT